MSEAETRTSPARPLRCAIVQLARMGDTIQSLMALRAAQQLYPQLKIHFICRESFAEAARRVPWIESVTALPVEVLLRPVIDGKQEEKAALPALAKWLEPLVQERWDFVVNWSYSESSAFLTALLPARVKLGFSCHKDLTVSSMDGWSHYVQAILQGGIRQNIHLTDILTTQLLTALQIHVGEPSAESANAPVTSKAFFALEVQPKTQPWSWRDNSRKWIGMQIGAGSPSKLWSSEKWAELARRILENHPECAIVLLGGKADEGRAREILSQLHERSSRGAEVLSLVGQTNFDLWASVIASCQWVISGDTAAVHLASVLGTRVLNISTGPVYFSETGPYGDGHYVIAPIDSCKACARGGTEDAHTCIDRMSAEAVYGAWSYACDEWWHRRNVGIDQHFRNLKLKDAYAETQVYRSKIRNASDGGGVYYEPLSLRPLALEHWLSQVIGHMARAWYCGWTPPVGQELKRATIGPELVRALRELDESSQVMLRICRAGTKACEELHEKSSGLLSPKLMDVTVKKKVSTAAKKVMHIDALLHRLAKAHRPLAVFSNLSRVFMHNLDGLELAELALESAESYRILTQGVESMREWVEHTLELVRPVAITTAQVVPLRPERTN